MSARNTVVRTTSAIDNPPALRTAAILSSACRACTVMSPPTRSPVSGLIGICPARNSRLPARTACEYGPAGFGACGVETGVFTTDALRRLDDFVRSQAARADANALDAAVDQGPHGLQVRLEPPRTDVVRVAVVTSHDRTLSANLATLSH